VSAFFVIYFINNKGEIQKNLATFLEIYVKEKFNLTLEIEDLEIARGGTDIFLKIQSLTAKDELQNYSLSFKNIQLRLNYYKLLGLKIHLQSNINELNIALKNAIPNNSKGLEKPDSSGNLAFYFRYLDVNVNTINANIEGEVFALQDSYFKFENFEIDNLNLEIKLISNIVQEKQNSFLSSNCFLKKERIYCDFKGVAIKNSTLAKSFHILENHNFVPSKYFIFSNAELDSLNFSIDFSEKRKNFELSIDAQNLDFFSPFLLEKKKLDFSNAKFYISSQNGRFESVFKLFFGKNKNIFGNASLSEKKEFTLDLVGENLYIKDVKSYWPNKYLYPVKSWISNSIDTDKPLRAELHLKNPYIKKDDFFVKAWFEDATLLYSEILPSVESASGMVDVSMDNVEISIDSATSKDIIATNSKAIYDVDANSLYLDLNLKGNFANFINFFVPNKEVNDIFSDSLKGDVDGKVMFELTLEEDADKMIEASSFKGYLAIRDFWTPAISGKSEKIVNFNFYKQANSMLTKILTPSPETIKLNASCDKSALEKLEFDFLINLNTGNIGILNFASEGKADKIAGNVGFNFKNEQFFSFASFSDIKFCNNDFLIDYNVKDKNIVIAGESLNLPELQNSDLNLFIKKFQHSDAKEHDDIKKFLKEMKDYNINASLEKLMLYKNFRLQNLDLKFNKNKTFKVKSDLINGFKNNAELKLNIVNLGEFTNSLSEKHFDFGGGTLQISSQVGNENELKSGIVLLENYQLKILGLDFSSKKLQSKFEEKDGIIKISDLKFINLFHTIIANGEINLNDFTLNVETYYTPSTLDVYNTAIDLFPVTSNFFNTITFDTFKNGILTLNYEVNGSLFQPKVQFRTGSTAKKILIFGGKVTLIIIGVNIILLPVIGILIYSGGILVPF
jgi:hypothetical protein